jgi:hypothetical protein
MIVTCNSTGVYIFINDMFATPNTKSKENITICLSSLNKEQQVSTQHLEYYRDIALLSTIQFYFTSGRKTKS